MKTTVDIADALLVEAKRLAKDRDITLRELIERGLRREVARCAVRIEDLAWKDLSYGDPSETWPQPAFDKDDWGAILEAANERPWLTRLLRARERSELETDGDPGEEPGPRLAEDLDESRGGRP